MHGALIGAGVAIAEVPSVRACVLGVVRERDLGPVACADFVLERRDRIARFLRIVLPASGQNKTAQQGESETVDEFVEVHGFGFMNGNCN